MIRINLIGGHQSMSKVKNRRKNIKLSDKIAYFLIGVVLVLFGFTIVCGLVPGDASNQTLQSTPLKNTYVRTNLYSDNQFLTNLASHQPFHSIILHFNPAQAKAPYSYNTVTHHTKDGDVITEGSKMNKKQQKQADAGEAKLIHDNKAGVTAQGQPINNASEDNNINPQASQN